MTGTWTILLWANLRHLREHRRRAVLTIVGLAAGVALMVAISAINATLNDSIEAEMQGLAGSAAFQIIPSGTVPLSQATLRAARSTPGVRVAAPVLSVISTLHHGGSRERLVLFGATPELTSLFGHSLDGLTRQLDEPGLIAAANAASRLGARAGQYVSAETDHGQVPLRVLSVLQHAPFSNLNGGRFALMKLSTAQTVFDRASQLSGIYIVTAAGVSKQQLRAQLQRRIGTVAIVGPPGGEGPAYRNTFESIAMISGDARTVGLFVAFFLLINTMAMSLAERREEIALLATNGARHIDIVWAFLAEAALLGALGSLIGIAAGALLAHLLIQSVVDSYNVLPITSSGPLVLPPMDVLAAFLGGVSITVVGALLPARRILQVRPIEALVPDAAYEWRYEHSRMQGLYAIVGVVAIAVSVLIALLLPIGSSPLYAALSLASLLAGAMLLLPVIVPALSVAMRRALSRYGGSSGVLASSGMQMVPGRTVVTAGAVTMAAALSIAIGASIGSYRSATEQAATTWYGAPLFVNPNGSAAYVADQPMQRSLGAKIARVAGVRSAFPMSFGLADNGGEQLIFYALPILEAAHSGQRVTGNLGISNSELVHIFENNEIAISRLTARRHHLRLGDKLPLYSPGHTYHLRVGGVFDDIASLDSIAVDHSTYEELSGDTRVDRFAVTLRRGADPATVKRRIQRLLNAQGVPATVLTRAQMASFLVNSTQSLFSVAAAIQAAALLVAGLVILSTMLTAVFERRREFGVARTVGMGPNQLRGSVVLEASGISMVGASIATALGLGLGLLITLSIENQIAWTVAFRPSPTSVLGIFATTTAIGAIASLYPSWLALRERIISLLHVD